MQHDRAGDVDAHVRRDVAQHRRRGQEGGDAGAGQHVDGTGPQHQALEVEIAHRCAQVRGEQQGQDRQEDLVVEQRPAAAPEVRDERDRRQEPERRQRGRLLAAGEARPAQHRTAEQGGEHGGEEDDAQVLEAERRDRRRREAERRQREQQEPADQAGGERRRPTDSQRCTLLQATRRRQFRL